MKKFLPSPEQQRIFDSNKKRMVISASAGSGKTTTMIEYISRLALSGVKIKRMLVLTFTKAAANEMKERLMLSLMGLSENERVQSQIDDLFTSDISTIHSFLEKIIKRNLHAFAYLEGFRILDEKESQSLMDEAFDEATLEYKQTQPDKFFDLFTTIRTVDTIKSMLFKLAGFIAAQADKQQSLAALRDYDENLRRAKEYLKTVVEAKLDEVRFLVDQCPRDNEKLNVCLAAARDAFSLSGQNLEELVSKCATIKLPTAPAMADGDPAKLAWGEIKKVQDSIKKMAAKLDLQNEELRGGKNRTIVAEIFDLFDIFSGIYRDKKVKINALDFNDLELNAGKLLDDPVVLEQLQENYDFVFIDEYQDTNPVQEKIVKLIAQKGRFVAIGDPKQGIYGFRNATSKIIIKDSLDCEKLSDGETHYLSTNYRSDKKILQFVNNVFSKVMTQNTANIDYKNSSMLQGEKQAPKLGESAVEILVTPNLKKEKTEPASGYDIYADQLSMGEADNLEAKVIAAKIDELLTRYFVDVETGERRRVQPSDIAILVRGKSGNTPNILNELKKKEIPFICSLKTDIMTKAHSQLIKQLLTLCIDGQNEIALTSFLLSPLCNVDMDKLATLPREKGQSICDAVYSSDDEQIVLALNRFEKFKLDCMFLGAKAALEKYFIEKEYFVYLKSQLGEDEVNETQTLLEVIGNFDSDKDIPSLLTYLKSNIGQTNLSGANAITVSTIHASKGLEYPIVLLAQTGAPIVKGDSASFGISEKFGFGTTCFEADSSSIILQAIKHSAAEQTRVDELMVLYVALTRAKSHLIITGSSNDVVENYCERNFKKIKTNMQLILSTNPESVGAKVEFIDEVESLAPQIKRIEVGQADKNLVQKINDYLNFEYPFLAQTQVKQKTSVTELASQGHEFTASQTSFAEEGTAYHEALKILDFESIKKVDDVKIQLEKSKFDENYLKIVDFNTIFANILLIKPFIKNKKIIKEKEFTMAIADGADKVLVQGTIDLYLKGEKNILIDYKFTRESDEKKLIARYGKQLDLYAEAIEKAEKNKIDEIYLISLKNNKIISYKK